MLHLIKKKFYTFGRQICEILYFNLLVFTLKSINSYFKVYIVIYSVIKNLFFGTFLLHIKNSTNILDKSLIKKDFLLIILQNSIFAYLKYLSNDMILRQLETYNKTVCKTCLLLLSVLINGKLSIIKVSNYKSSVECFSPFKHNKLS